MKSRLMSHACAQSSSVRISLASAWSPPRWKQCSTVAMQLSWQSEQCAMRARIESSRCSPAVRWSVTLKRAPVVLGGWCSSDVGEYERRRAGADVLALDWRSSTFATRLENPAGEHG